MASDTPTPNNRHIGDWKILHFCFTGFHWHWNVKVVRLTAFIAVIWQSWWSVLAVGYIDCQPGSAGNFVWKFRGKENVASGTTWALFKYPIRRLIGRSHNVSKPRDSYLELSDRYEIWQASRQYCCRCACQISKESNNLNYQSRVFATSWNLMLRHLVGYWNVALVYTETFKDYLVDSPKWPKVGGSSHPKVETFSVSKTLSQDHPFTSREWMQKQRSDWLHGEVVDVGIYGS